MKEAYEIGWLAAYMYAGSTISLIHIDDFQFFSPVEVGTAVQFEAKVGYVSGGFIIVFVEVTKKSKEKQKTKTNEQHIIF